MKFDFCMVYITTKDIDEARIIAKKVVDQRLAACANVVEDMQSFYHWKGTVEEDTESVLILKTRTDLFSALVQEVKRHHSYEVPCILAYPILDGNPEYLDWLRSETKH